MTQWTAGTEEERLQEKEKNAIVMQDISYNGILHSIDGL